MNKNCLNFLFSKKNKEILAKKIYLILILRKILEEFGIRQDILLIK